MAGCKLTYKFPISMPERKAIQNIFEIFDKIRTASTVCPIYCLHL